VSALSLQFVRGGVWLPPLGLWLDPHQRQIGPERVFVSHAHSDHTAAHREVILSVPTARLMRARSVKARMAHALNFGETRGFQGAEVPWQITLLPAGHIFGSAMAFVEAGGESLLYTGDFKLRRGLSAEPCEPRHADVLVMETTYGRPEYQFPPTDSVLQEVIRFCRETLGSGETAVLLGYSLGKSQELLCALADAGLPIMLHDTVHKLTQVYEQLGRKFPEYERFDPGNAARKVLLCPPHANRSPMLRNLGPSRLAIFTGWAVEPSCRFRYGADVAFPLSDHADFPDLIEMVKRVAPGKVYTLHGFAADFARTLRSLGFDAQSLSEDEQLELALGAEAGP
jgi:DNA ligase-1